MQFVRCCSEFHIVDLQNDYQDSVSWRHSERDLKDSAGLPVRHFHAFLSSSHRFVSNFDQAESSTTFFHDALSRQVGTLHADHTWSKANCDAWVNTEYDAGDTVMINDPANDPDVGTFFRRLEKSMYLSTWYNAHFESSTATRWDLQAASKSGSYHQTPREDHYDALGPVILSIASKGKARSPTRHEYNYAGNVSAKHDALGRLTERMHHDLLGNILSKNGMDYGRRSMLPACDGTLILAWNDRGVRTRSHYDKLRRVTEVWTANEMVQKP